MCSFLYLRLKKKYQKYIEWRLYIPEGGKLLKPKPFTPDGVQTVMGMIWK